MSRLRRRQELWVALAIAIPALALALAAWLLDLGW